MHHQLGWNTREESNPCPNGRSSSYPMFSCPAFHFADEENKTLRSLSQQKAELDWHRTSDLRASWEGIQCDEGSPDWGMGRPRKVEWLVERNTGHSQLVRTLLSWPTILPFCHPATLNDLIFIEGIPQQNQIKTVIAFPSCLSYFGF